MTNLEKQELDDEAPTTVMRDEVAAEIFAVAERKAAAESPSEPSRTGAPSAAPLASVPLK